MNDVPRETAEPARPEPGPPPAEQVLSDSIDRPEQEPVPPEQGEPWAEDVVVLRESLRLAQDDRLAAPAGTRVIALANQKGGVAKTTTAVNLAAALTVLGRRVLVVDMDPQGNASSALGVEHRPGTVGTYEVLVSGKAIADARTGAAELPSLGVVPATVDLAGADIELVSQVARENRLRRALAAHLAEEEQQGRRVDYVLVDCPPSLGLLTVNALVAADEVLIPLQSEYYALEGLGHLLTTIDLIRQHLNPALRVGAILLTMFDGRTRLAPQVAEELRQHFPAQLLRTVVPRSVRISEAPSHGQTVLQYDPSSVGARAYLAVARELAERATVERSAEVRSAEEQAQDEHQDGSTARPGMADR